jgi:hypothetical protein
MTELRHYTESAARPREAARPQPANTAAWLRKKMVNGATLRANEVSKAVYEDFLPGALATGAYQAAPEPRVIAHGLQNIQAALDAQLTGVSAANIVVSLDGQ